ncbi:MAG: ribosome small subunit-dependent GTPase A [Mycoplasmatales bacterium]
MNKDQRDGVVVRAIANLFYVEINDQIVACNGSTKLKLKKERIYTGDYVRLAENDDYIIEVLPRTNMLIRPPLANVHNAILVFSAKEPAMNFGLLDRMLLVMNANKLESTLIVTKTDLLTDEEKTELSQQLDYYNNCFEKIFWQGFDEDITIINQLFQKDKYVITGQTGVGKSTLINRLIPDLELKTQEISKALNRGKHTTREVTFYKYLDSVIIDTPGFSALDIPLAAAEIRDLYFDFHQYAHSCKFSTCYHVSEPKCTVKEAVEEGKIPQLRYENYVKLITESRERKWVQSYHHRY